MDRSDLWRSWSQVTGTATTFDPAHVSLRILTCPSNPTLSDYIVDSSLSSIVVPYAWFDRISFKQALQYLCEAGMCTAFVDRSGRIVISPSTPGASVVYAFDNDKSIFDINRKQQWSKVFSIVEVPWNTYEVQTASSNYLTGQKTLFFAIINTLLIYIYYSSWPNKK